MQSLFLFIWAQRKKKKRSKILFLQFRNYCELMGWDGKSWVWWEKTSLFSHMNQLPFQPFSYGCQLCQMKSYSECHSSWGWSFEIDSIYRIKQIFSNGCDFWFLKKFYFYSRFSCYHNWKIYEIWLFESNFPKNFNMSRICCDAIPE